VFDGHVKTRRAPDELVETLVDLGPAFTGHVIVLAEPIAPPKRERAGEIQREWCRCWVQSTGIGLQAFWDQDSLWGWSSVLGDGRPLAGAQLSLIGSSSRSRSNASGLAKLELGESSPILVASQGSDSAFVPARNRARWEDASISPLPTKNDTRLFLLTDRGLYKPGEHVYAKGWVRLVRMERGGDVAPVPPPESPSRNGGCWCSAATAWAPSASRVVGELRCPTTTAPAARWESPVHRTRPTANTDGHPPQAVFPNP
jgi:hypothetical protein